MAELITIKKIKTAVGDHDIDAKYWDGHSFSEITDLVHGVVDTYVIPAQTTGTSDYKAIVESSAAQVTTTKTKLGALTGTPAEKWDKFGVGDIVLMGATSDGKVNFDRWISSVSGDNITLDVLETQVATHHHTLGVSTGNALTGMNTPTQTATIPVVDTAVSVVTSVVGKFLTSVEFSGGNDSLGLSHVSVSEEGSISHIHTVNSHSHNITPSTLVSQTVSAYTSLTSESKSIHSHSTETVAGAHVDASKPITIVTGSNGSDTFVKTLTQTSTDTGQNTAGKETNSNTSGLSTTVQESTDTITSDIQTLSSGAHTHDVTTTTTENVVKTVSVAPSVVTSVSYSFTEPTVQANVVTSITKVSKTVVTSANLTGTTTFMSTWSASVDDNGILSFTSTTATVGISAPTTTISTINAITSGSQNAGSLSISAPRSAQSHTSGTVSASGSAASNGGHTHGFGHTHTIPSHTHSIAAHTHKYDKATVNASATAITSLSTTSYTPHTHTNISVAGVVSGETTITYVTGGSRTLVVRNLKESAVSTTSIAPETNEVYTKLTGDIEFPGLNITSASISVERKSITPAAPGSEKAIKSITFTSSDFVTGLTSGSIKTSENKGGN
jgi:hypothetical protein